VRARITVRLTRQANKAAYVFYNANGLNAVHAVRSCAQAMASHGLIARNHQDPNVHALVADLAMRQMRKQSRASGGKRA